jgi:nicotinate-nucleotide adenylyltransferase
MPADAMIRYAARHRLSFPDHAAVVRFNPSLLHGYISADLARRVFNVTDREILDAIRQHTVGAPHMTTLAKIIYLADTTSPDRRRWGITRLRRMMKHDLDRAMLMAIGEKTAYVLTQRKWLHPQAAAAWNYFVMVTRDAHQ